MDRSASAIFSLKTLAWCWVGLLTSLGAGAVALQLTAPAPLLVQAAIQATPLPQPVVVAPPAPNVAPVPFQNHSLLAMLPPPAERFVEQPLHQAPRASVPLPVPPVPPAPRVARLEPQHRVVRVYAAERAYAPPEWAPYENEYVRMRPYAYAAPQSYYGW